MIRKKRYYGHGTLFSKRADAFIAHTVVGVMIIFLSIFKTMWLTDVKCRFPEINFQNFLRRRQNSSTIPQQHEVELPQHFQPEPSQPHQYQGYPQYYEGNPNVAIGIPVNYHNLRYSRSIHKTQKGCFLF